MVNEIARRRTFAIISHPDAGKTTLTEKLLLFGGQIQVAGAVKSNKIRKTATSDWMEIEKQRGISVTTSVMEFDYTPSGDPESGCYKVNILDTPGHQDFAEDTFRTLTAVDSAIIVVDSAKGVEAQTRKLMEVCRMRKTPVIIFINKMDREGKDISVRPLSWPINQGAKFKGVYNIYEQNLNLFTPDKQKVTEKVEVDINSQELDERVGERDAEKLREDLELVDGVYPEFDVQTYLDADVAPVFFGSALNNFGVQELLDCFVQIAPCPRPTVAEERTVTPDEPKFTGFIFKITANIDPNHRSCIAFCKVCGKTLRFSSPTQFMAQRKETIDEAWPGDIVGLPDNGIFKIGDTLTEGENLHFRGLPSFSPEMFKYIENADPMKTKQLEKGINQLMDEGVAQLFINQFNNRKVVRSHPVPPRERIRRQVPLGAYQSLQSLLGGSNAGLRERTRRLQEAQAPVHGSRPRRPRRLPRRLRLRPANGPAGLRAHPLPLYQRVLNKDKQQRIAFLLETWLNLAALIVRPALTVLPVTSETQYVCISKAEKGNSAVGQIVVAFVIIFGI